MTKASTSAPSFEDLKRHACCDFLAGDEKILIVPNFTLEKPVELVSVSKVGPFTALTPVLVPLWLAVLLKQKTLCRIPTPEWMEVETLKRILAYERDEDRFSQKLPFRYLEISRTLLSVGELDEEDSIRILLQDISSIRMDKIRRNLHTFSEESLQSTDTLPIIDVTGIGSLELAVIAPFCSTAFSHHLMLSRKEDTNDTKTTGEVDQGDSRLPKTANRLRRFR
mmetsp:Transcript_10706/g.16403  ORF Transcript_10706/g.16403 Transcript_10706/m.16403 type:complete len:224 (-) Transcript_10706:137-808(-)|eukprot:CAMPEP_0178905654 /NCGR_PEP_ID=MMETSP0786-20121207/6396_1 /TAXON_ID=186022 /ORGANISM="Thalassionema frauenfeldii, Strain CCMP 1798" /LENGTH=223 /DNA_ID=CAMNT_0020577287 /DNA_START=76 /DNA_END=747 /DNA_ORIENTATION=-